MYKKFNECLASLVFLCIFSFLAAFLEANKFLRKLKKCKNDRKGKIKMEMLRLQNFQEIFIHHIFKFN